MHGLLQANRERRTRAELLAMAQQLGLDAARFRADLDCVETMAAAKSDQDAAALQGVSAIPLVLERFSFRCRADLQVRCGWQA